MASKSLSFLLFGEDVSASHAFKKVARSAEESGAKVKGAFGGASAAGGVLALGGLVAGLGLATKGAADFQTQMVRLVTAAGESQGNLKLVSAGVMAISSSTGTGLKATGDAMYYVESAGFHGAKGLEVLKAAAQGAKVEGADTKVVADALTTALTDLGAKAGPPAVVMSQLVATVAHGKMTMDDLAGSLHSVLPNASAIGISFAQVAGAIATMTAQGISADQATQNLNHAILSLANPTAVQTKAMAAFGLNSSVVAKNLGKEGLTGTLQELSDTITQHMGPAGLTITNALNTSQIAAGKVTEGYKVLAPAARTYFDALVKGGAISKSTVDGTKGLTLAQDAQLKQLVVLYKQAHGFSQLLKSGSPDAMTYSAALSKMTGGITGLQVALHLTGANMGTFKSNVKDIGKATTDTSGNVADFAVKQKNLAQQMDVLKTTATNLGVQLGTKLIPAFSAAAGFALKHQTALIGLGSALLGVKVAMGVVTIAQAVMAAGLALAGGAVSAFETLYIGAMIAMDTAMGPIGLAIAGITLAVGLATHGFGLFGHTAKQQVKPVQELTDAITQDGNAFGKATAALENHTLASNGAYTAGKRLGLSQSTVLAATMGNAHAMSVVAAATQSASDAYKRATTATGANSGSLHAQQQALSQATQAQKDNASAASTLADLLPNMSAQLNASKGAATDSARAIAGLSAAERAVPPSVSTTVRVEGIQGALDAIHSVVETANNSSGVIHITTVNTQTGAISGGRQAFASGTDYAPGGSTLVGEQGPEIVNLPQGSRVQSASRTRLGAGGGGGDLHVHVHVTQPLGTPDQIARVVVPALRTAYNRGMARP